VAAAAASLSSPSRNEKPNASTAGAKAKRGNSELARLSTHIPDGEKVTEIEQGRGRSRSPKKAFEFDNYSSGRRGRH